MSLEKGISFVREFRRCLEPRLLFQEDGLANVGSSCKGVYRRVTLVLATWLPLSLVVCRFLWLVGGVGVPMCWLISRKLQLKL
ncbi:hypothetical protein LINPERHAP1_LOCUS437 [Linum perenne]